MERIREHFPALPVAFIAVKPSPARFWNLSNIRRANALIQAAIAGMPGAAYLDVFAEMLSPAGGSRPELFSNDGLHMNSAGYDLWTARIRAWLDSVSASPPPCP
jgi:lysophospholipase L1-like esterase